MTQTIDPCDIMRNNLIAAAVGLQQCTKTDGTEVLIPGTDKRILIGGDAYLARVALPAAQPRGKTDERALFEAWKGYPLPEFNDEGRFDWDWLHREFVAFKAGLARAAIPVAAPEAPTLPYSRALHDDQRAADEPVDANPRYFFRVGWNAFRNELLASTGVPPEAPNREQQANDWRDCPDCEGSGRISPNELCARCNQSGILPAATVDAQADTTTASEPQCWSDLVPCDKCDKIGWHVCRATAPSRNAAPLVKVLAALEELAKGAEVAKSEEWVNERASVLLAALAQPSPAHVLQAPSQDADACKTCAGEGWVRDIHDMEQGLIPCEKCKRRGRAALAATEKKEPRNG